MNMQIQHILKKNTRGIIELNIFYAFKEETGDEKNLNYEKLVESIALNLRMPKEKVEKIIKEIEKDGVVNITGKYLTLINKEKLSKLIEGNVF